MEDTDIGMLSLLTHNQYLENRIKGTIRNGINEAMTNKLKENLASVGNMPSAELNIATILRRYDYDPPLVQSCEFCPEDRNHFHIWIVVTRLSPGLTESRVQVNHEELVLGRCGPEFAIHQGLWSTFLKINRRTELLKKDGVPVVTWKTPQG